MKVKGEHGWSGNTWGVLSIALSRPGTQWRNKCINAFYMTTNERRIVIQCPFGLGNVNGATGFAIERHVGAVTKAKNRMNHYLHYIEL